MEVEFYCSSNGTNYVKDVIMDQPPKVVKKIWRQLNRVEKYNLNFLTRAGVMKKLHGYELWEIIVNFGNICYRIFCVIREKTYHLLHMFIKKSNSTPYKEIKTALNRAADLDYKLSFARS